MTSVSNNNSVSQLTTLVPSQSVANATQAATNGGTSTSPQSTAPSSGTIAVNLPAGYASATQAIVGYLLNQQGGSDASAASTSGASPGSAAPGTTASDTSKSKKASDDAHGAGGSGGSSSSATTTTTENMPDGSVVQITTDGSGKIISEAVVKAATQNNAQTGSNSAQTPQSK